MPLPMQLYRDAVDRVVNEKIAWWRIRRIITGYGSKIDTDIECVID
ncbi:hypothetical protein RM533_00015 [Croceicoccus sp. F390]|uniref:Uncharacterized protein n=1 Tax=Croceicoccus esteveae TaxID=3075597 RepID=A0ABU2ZER0_9SPHN|nr:hypothetical protein [Croceicoccus sp. F390]MDT0574563.1 hypothetical protein [Croceicoccus sp. F390]